MRRPRTNSNGWMPRAAALTFSLLLGLALVAQDADARRLGGGTSFGRQSPNVTKQQSAPPSRDTTGQTAPSQQAAPQPTQPSPGQSAPQPAGNRWLGPLAGLAAGVGIAALLSHFGMGGAFADGLGSLLLVALMVFAAVFLWRMLRGGAAAQRRMEPVYSVGTAVPTQPSVSLSPSSVAQPGSIAATAGTSVTGFPLPSASPPVPWGVPADFDVAGFLRSAKVYFIRLQAAWDARDLVDIREFTTPEAFAEIKLRVDEEKGTADKTDVVSLDAQLLGIETGDHDYLASVRFTGTIQETGQPTPAPFEEVWNLAKPKDGRTGWLLAGIQQVH